MKIAIVIVTFNRKELLKVCLQTLISQKENFNTIFIVDNASEDGTGDLFIDGGDFSELRFLRYHRMELNSGGAGGFHLGMEMAMKEHEAAILMDDDGIPTKSLIPKLVENSRKYQLGIANALVIDKDNTELLAFGLGSLATIRDIENLAYKDVLMDLMNPFNGTLVTKEVFEKIGNIKREMFIWGDEREYIIRAKKNGIKVGTILDAVHLHPKNRASNLTFMGISFVEKPERLEHFYFRNIGYINAQYFGLWKVITYLSKYSFFLLLVKKSGRRLLKFWKFYFDGVMNRYKLS